MVLPPLLYPSSFCHSRALHCRRWLSRPHPRQLPPRAPMLQTATLLSALLPLRRLLSLSPPPLPSMPRPPLALVTRSGTLNRTGRACLLVNFTLLLSFCLSFSCLSQCSLLMVTFPFLVSLTRQLVPIFSFSWMFEVFPGNKMLLETFFKYKHLQHPNIIESSKWKHVGHLFPCLP